MKLIKPIQYQTDWSIESLQQYDYLLANMANRYHLDVYPSHVEIINSEQMLEAYAANGLPLFYHHWSFGKQFIDLDKHYRLGKMDLAYEIVINANPCHAYLISESNLTMQVIVLAHACYGHNSFFKNNNNFKLWTDPDYILDYLLWASHYITQCEKLYGVAEVEHIIDAAHALKNYGVYHYKRPQHLSLKAEKLHTRQSSESSFRPTSPAHDTATPQPSLHAHFPTEPEENILAFIEEYSPILKDWQREIIRIIRTLAQYFYPQRQTKVMNEGWATFWHYTLIQSLYDDGWLSDEFMLHFIQYHSQVIHQPDYDSNHYSGINPYTLGYKIFTDIKRICEQPTPEDKYWFPDLYGTDWLKAVDFAMRNFKDESFIAQYLSPHTIRDLKLFAVLDNANQLDLEVSDIHDNAGYQHIRNTLAAQYNASITEPHIQVYETDLSGDRHLTLRHFPAAERPMAGDAPEVLAHVYQLWGYPVHLETVTHAGAITASYHYPPVEST